MEKELERLEEALVNVSDAKGELEEAQRAVGLKIRELRKAKDISLRELGEKVKLSAPFLYDVELGRRFLSPEKLAQVVKILTK